MLIHALKKLPPIPADDTRLIHGHADTRHTPSSFHQEQLTHSPHAKMVRNVRYPLLADRRGTSLVPRLKTAKGSAAYHANGSLKHATLAATALIQGTVYPKGTDVEFSTRGTLQLVALPIRLHIQGKLFAPHAHTNLYSNHHIYFHANGKVMSGALAEPQTIDGVSCEKLTLEESSEYSSTLIVGVSFHPNGRLATARLAAPLGVGRIVCARGTDIAFHDNGALKSCVLARPMEIERKQLSTGSTLQLRKDGTLSKWSPPDH